ncbi:MAG: preprotein translocase subunit SecA [Planctomycetes bacterium]|nr:preprotein translocase subunit SecA [Planctomycetota bacterium]
MTASRIPSGNAAKMLSWLGGPVRRRVARWSEMLDQVNALEPIVKDDTDQQLRKRSLSVRYRLKSGERVALVMPEAFAIVREAGRRALNMRHFDVQILGGVALVNGSIAEMQTGEGKTLTATLPLYLHALAGKGAHLATVNDYLAARDAEWMRPLYELLGLSVGVIQTKDTPDERRESYACDITYGTAKEFGFDFLRDRLLLRRLGFRQEDFVSGMSEHRLEGEGDKPVQRSSYFCLVDEADSILIDEARTPLIIGSLGDKIREQVEATYKWSAKHAPKFEEEVTHEVDDDTKKVELTAEGRQLVRSLPQPDILRSVGLIDLYQYIERAIKVNRDFHLDRQYVVQEGEIVIVDEFTGRLAEGRKWRDGIHQALEAKEEIEVTVPTGQAARITVQDLFLRYQNLAGMTGTARSSAREVLKIYRTRVIPMPTNKPPQRTVLPDRVFRDTEEKFRAIVGEVQDVNTAGRPVLIGTRSIDKSELLSSMLTEAELVHQVLNANEVEREADIVAQAGQNGKITVATNMAGRGTDIKLGDGVAELGGLHVICTELHDSARIDRQLVGRCGRQGDPGTVRQYLALDDEILLSGLGPDRAKSIKQLGEAGGNLDQYARLPRRAQRKVEKNHFRDRMILLHHEKERKKVQREMGQDPFLDTPD